MASRAEGAVRLFHDAPRPEVWAVRGSIAAPAVVVDEVQKLVRKVGVGQRLSRNTGDLDFPRRAEDPADARGLAVELDSPSDIPVAAIEVSSPPYRGAADVSGAVDAEDDGDRFFVRQLIVRWEAAAGEQGQHQESAHAPMNARGGAFFQCADTVSPFRGAC